MTDSEDETRLGEASEPGRVPFALRRDFGGADPVEYLVFDPGGLPRRFGPGESEAKLFVPEGAGVESVETDLLADVGPFVRLRDARGSSSSDESSSERLSSGFRSEVIFRDGVEGAGSAPS